MKKENKLIFYISITFFLIGMMYGIIMKNIFSNRYDVNRDGKVNEQDYVELKNYILNQN